MPSKTQQGWRVFQSLVLGVALALSIQVAPSAEVAAAHAAAASKESGLAAPVVIASAVAAGSGRVHVVRPGESLWSIAEQELGAGAKWRSLYRLNEERIGAVPQQIYPGLRLVMPSDERAVRLAARRYRVKPGDSLWRIAERRLGSGERWRRIYKLNREVIGDNPARLQPGTVLVLRGAPAAVAEAPRPRVARVRPAKPVAKAPVPKPVAKPVAKAPVPKPVAKPVAKAPVPKPIARPEAKAPVAKPVAKPQAKAPIAKPEAKAPAAEPRNPFSFRGGQPGMRPPEAAGTPPGRNPFSFGNQNPAPGARTVQGQAQRRMGGMPVVPSYPDDAAMAGRKGKAPVAVDVKGGKAVAKKKGRRHMASSPGPRGKNQ